MKKWMIPALCAAFFLTGCKLPFVSEDGYGPQFTENGSLLIGTSLTAKSPTGMDLLDSKDILAGEGLYYSTWTKGDPVPYENSDGDTVDLYEQQLYLLSCECDLPADAEKTLNAWLEGTKSYHVLTEDVCSASGTDFTVITYTCESADNPYAHGVSAFGRNGETAVCAEFTCTENCKEDHSDLLCSFLNELTFIHN